MFWDPMERIRSGVGFDARGRSSREARARQACEALAGQGLGMSCNRVVEADL